MLGGVVAFVAVVFNSTGKVVNDFGDVFCFDMIDVGWVFSSLFVFDVECPLVK